MALRVLTILALTAAVASPALAQERAGRRRPDANGNQEQGARAPERAGRDRAVPRGQGPRAEAPRDAQPEARPVRPAPIQPSPQARRDDGRYDRDSRTYRGPGNGRYDGRYDTRRYGYGRAVPRRYTPRIIRPTVVRVIPYRPYVYRPSYRIGVIYGADGYYPYGYTPRAYYDPIPGRPYGGLRITDAPRWARVFADGYYVGLVNDFDGIFQHLNLEAGPHRIEVEDDNYGAIAFDVFIRPGQTITYRAGF
ncbi:MAG TPA: hypothetical protein VFK57_02575 [Vicinamibacterales bacterium]|nr:hypothetical protein [Vicinamibacterales bacterium]